MAKNKTRLVIDDRRTFPNVEGIETVHRRDAFSGLDSLYDEGPWDEVWLDWNLGFTKFGGEFIVEMLGADVPDNVGRFFVHTSDGRAGRKMVKRLASFTKVPVVYASDIDYALAGK